MLVFLFTDIEGSTRLWELHTGAMTAVIARRDEILRELDVLPADFARHLAPLAGFRNILVHEYLVVDWDEVYRALHRLEDLERFAKLVRRWLAHRAPSKDNTGH